MGVTRFEIELDSPDKSYYPGQTIRGVVHLIVKKPLKTKGGIKICARGFAEVLIPKASVTFTARENYFHDVEYLVGGSTFSKLEPIREGHHQFSFLYHLPRDIPASAVDTGKGRVVYLIAAELKLDWCRSRKIVLPIEIKGELDLNYELTKSANEVQVIKRKRLHYFSFNCSKGPIGFALRFRKTGFATGEYLRFIAELNNKSSRKVVGCSAELVQRWTYYAGEQSDVMLLTVCSVEGPGLSGGEYKVWRGNKFVIPPLPPSGFQNCQIINVEYLLKFEMKIAGMAANLRTVVPIIIGSTPLSDAALDFLKPSPLPVESKRISKAYGNPERRYRQINKNIK